MASTDKTAVKTLIQSIAPKYNLDPKLITAFVQVESNFDTWAVRYEDHFEYIFNAELFAKANRITEATETQCQKMSWGLMQIMGGTARGLGYKGPLTALTDGEYNLHLACKYLVQLGRRYPGHSADIISAYNAGSVRLRPDGDYSNQDYVEKVITIWRDVKV